MYQDPTIGQLYFAALMRREYGAMKADLISRGMSAMEADRTASLYVSNRPPEWSKRFSTPTQDWVAAQGGSVLRTSLEMYTTDLRSITGGRGVFNMEFSHYEVVPAHISQDIINARQKELAAQKEE